MFNQAHPSMQKSKKRSNMKSKVMFLTMALTMALATNTVAQDSISRGRTTAPDQTGAHASVAQAITQAVAPVVSAADVTINGRPATKQEKQAAKRMVKQAAKMAGKAAQVAANAVTNPAKAEQLGEELEQMGDQLEEMGDDLARMDSTLSTLAEDTTFFYEDEDSDEVILSDEDIDEMVDEWVQDSGGPKEWVKKVFGGGLGLLGGTLAALAVVVVALFLFALFTAPVWIVLLLLFLVIRSGRKKDAGRTAQAYQTPPTSARPQAASAQKQPHASRMSAAPAAMPQAKPMASDENQETWKSGIRLCCLGVGLIICFIAIGWTSLWGIGALVACLGVAKLVIATTTKGRSGQYVAGPQQESFVTGLGTAEEAPTAETHPTAAEQPSAGDYNKSENA